MSSTASPFFVDTPTQNVAESNFSETSTATLLRITCGLTDEQIDELSRRADRSSDLIHSEHRTGATRCAQLLWYGAVALALAVASQVLTLG